MADIASQLSEIFKAGLQSNPDLAKSLANAIHDDLGTGGKQTKAEANYRTTDGKESCSSCDHFDGSSSCELVSGHISPNGVSDSYEPSTSDSTDNSGDSGSSSDSSGPSGSSSKDSSAGDSTVASDSQSGGKDTGDGG